MEDNSPLKIAVKARQIGYSFAATLRAVLRCLEGKTTWIFLSKGERQSRLLMEKVQDHIRSCGIMARTQQSTFFEGTLLKQLEVRFPNGSVIYGLPANPDTARGYSGHVTLDEFAFHADADKIYAALFPTITRGYSLEVISTPNGTQGKFYELAKAAGLVEPVLGARGWGLGTSPLTPSPSPSGRGWPRSAGTGEGSSTQNPAPSTWSAHCCDIYDAVKQGLRIDLALLRAGCEDETTWQQEFCCQFVSSVENFFPPELLAACLSAEASTDTPLPTLARESGTPLSVTASALGALSGLGVRDTGLGAGKDGTTPPSAPLLDKEGTKGWSAASPESRVPSREFFLGIDIGRHHDRTVFWLDEVQVLGAGDWGLGKESLSALFPSGRGVGNECPSTQHLAPSTPAQVSIARVVRTMQNAPFADQLAFARELLSLLREDGGPLVRRAAIDATGIGAPLAEALAREFGPRVEPVIFTAAVKEDLAFRTKRRLEARLTLLPDTREIRRAFSAVKKYITPSGNLRFDAARTDAGHADEFWAKALADLAADSRPAASHAEAFLADAAPLIPPSAFSELDLTWHGGEWD